MVNCTLWVVLSFALCFVLAGKKAVMASASAAVFEERRGIQLDDTIPLSCTFDEPQVEGSHIVRYYLAKHDEILQLSGIVCCACGCSHISCRLMGFVCNVGGVKMIRGL